MAETVSFRPKRSKQDLQRAFGNVSRKLNELIERDFQPVTDWRDILRQPRPELTDEEFDQWMRPE